MHILYGVVGEGMGHATRSRVILEHLLSRGHRVRVVVSGKAHRFLENCFDKREGIELVEIHGLKLIYEGNSLDVSESVLENLWSAPRGLIRNLESYARVAQKGLKPQLVISDFESWAYFYGRAHGLPVVSLDNQSIITRCEHPPEVKRRGRFARRLTQLAVRMKLPKCYHFLITSFFYPHVMKPRTTLVPPILRPAILQAKREPGEHVLVYQTSPANRDLIPLLQRLPGRFRVYGMHGEGTQKNVTFCPFSETTFVDDLRTAKALITGGGFSLMCEAVHLHVPTLSVPVRNQFEQELNAFYLAHLGYGASSSDLADEEVADFLRKVSDYSTAIQRYVPQDNAMTFQCLDEVLENIASGSAPPASLHSASMGSVDHSMREEPTA